jgi:hypothetical protein
MAVLLIVWHDVVNGGVMLLLLAAVNGGLLSCVILAMSMSYVLLAVVIGCRRF